MTFSYPRIAICAALLALLGSFPLNAVSQMQSWNAALDLVANEKPDNSNLASTELSNPNARVPEWSYGYRETAVADLLTLFSGSSNHTNMFQGVFDDLEGWQQQGWGLPTALPVVVATVSGTHSGLGVDEMLLHPSNASNQGTFVVVRWTAPANGIYQLKSQWRDLSPEYNDGVDAHLVFNGASIFDATVLNSGTASLNRTLFLSAGDHLDFVVGPGPSGSDYSDSTGLKVSIVRAEFLETLGWNGGGDLALNEKPDSTTVGSTELINPNGKVPEWSYGFRSAVSGTAMALFSGSANHTNKFYGLHDDVEGWQADSGIGAIPLVMANVSGTVAVGFAPDELRLHPGSGGNTSTYDVVRWTAPFDGTFVVSSDWRHAGEGGDGVDAHLVLNGTSIFDANLLNGGTSSAGYRLALAKGDKLDFVVGPGIAGAASFDTTFLKARVGLGQLTPQLSVTGTTTSSVDLSWSDVASETGYTLEYRADGDSAWTDLNPAPGQDVTSAVVSGLAEGVTYQFRVRAEYAQGSSFWSNVVSATLPIAPPSAPSLGYDSAIGHRVSLSWTDSDKEDSFVVERTLAGANDWAVTGTVGQNVLAFVDRTVSPLTAYEYRVKAVFGALSTYSNVCSISTPELLPPATPSGVTIDGTDALVLKWDDVEDEVGYLIERRVASKNQWIPLVDLPADTTQYADVSAKPGQAYVYRVLARNAAGFSLPSEEVQGMLSAKSTGTPVLVTETTLHGVRVLKGATQSFQITVPEGVTFLRILTGGGRGNISMTLTSGNFAAISQNHGNSERIELANPAAGDYTLQLIGKGSDGARDMNVRVLYGTVDRQPDLTVDAGNGPGESDVLCLDPSGQIVPATARVGKDAVYTMALTNFGNIPETFELAAVGTLLDRGLNLQIINLDSNEDVTTAVLNGTYLTSSIAVGGTQTFQLLVHPAAGARNRSATLDLSAKDHTSRNFKDSLRLRIRVE